MEGFKPFTEYVIVKPIERQEDGMFDTSTTSETKNVGEVVAVGPGTKDWKMSSKVGDRVLFLQSAAKSNRFFFKGEWYIGLSEIKREIITIL